MYDPGRMCRGDGVGDLGAVVERLAHRQTMSRDHLIERPARHELHRNEVDALVLRYVIDGDDTGVIER